MTKSAKTIEVTERAFRLWLEAHRPPWAWFMALSPLEQERLAQIGTEHTQDVAVGFGYAVQNPGAIDAATHPESAESETDLLTQVAAAVAAKLSAKAQQQAPATMGGLGDRRQSVVNDRQAGKDRGRSFIGKRPKAAK